MRSVNSFEMLDTKWQERLGVMALGIWWLYVGLGIYSARHVFWC